MSTNNAEDWISQAEAARIRGVSRQAINKLVSAGRIRILAIAGRTLVHRTDVANYKGKPTGRPKKNDKQSSTSVKGSTGRCA